MSMAAKAAIAILATLSPILVNIVEKRLSDDSLSAFQAKAMWASHISQVGSSQ